MVNLIRQTVKLPASPPEEELVIAFDQPEARGTVILRQCPFGLEIILPDVAPIPVAVLDFWHASETGQIDRVPDDPAPVGQIVVHSPAQNSDPVGRVRFFPARTIVDFEMGIRRETSPTGPVWGYPLAEYPPVELLVNHAGVQVYRALAGDGQPSSTWFTTDPDRADLTMDGPHFWLTDLTDDPATRLDAVINPARLRQLLRTAIDCGQVTVDGLTTRLRA
jgi:hypothetical protein